MKLKGYVVSFGFCGKMKAALMPMLLCGDKHRIKKIIANCKRTSREDFDPRCDAQIHKIVVERKEGKP